MNAIPILLLLLLAQLGTALGEEGLLQHQYVGTLGRSRIGLTILRSGNTVTGGHYFYQKYLQDIPINGSVAGQEIVLSEQGGGTFHLRFVGNGSNGHDPLNFENSVGMNGTWLSPDGKRTLPISLRGQFILYGAPSDHRYETVTSESDQQFERRVRAVVQGLENNDRRAVLKLVSYPLRVNLKHGKHKRLVSPASVLESWDEIFTPALIAKVSKEALPHDMFVRNDMAMVGNGELWFDKKGLAVVNVPD